MLLKLVFLLLLFSKVFAAQEECLSRDYGESSVVCVCNANHCDTVPKPEKVEAPKYLIYTSSKSGLRFQQEEGEFQDDASQEENVISINTEEKFQTIIGWGGAFTDAAGINIASLEEEVQDKLLRSYFSEDGIEYSLCRVPIGGTDFSTHGYSYNDGEEDLELTNFRLAEEDYKYKIPYILAAKALTNDTLRLFASAWTAPTWMKTNGEYNGYGFLKEEMYQAWADYFVKFLDLYTEEELPFWGITTGNEPSIAYIVFVQINTVGWTPENLGAWVLNNLGPTLKNSSHPDIKLMILDDQRLFLPWYVTQALADNATRDYVDGIAFHWYTNPETSPSLLTDTHDLFPEKFILSTEASNVVILNTPPVVLGAWERGEYYSIDIIEDVSNWASGWVDWNLVLDLTGGPTYIDNFIDAAIIVNSTAGEFYKQPMYYHLGHFSKFVPPDSVRVGITTNAENLMAVAFQRPDDSIALIILNKNEEAVQITVSDNSRGSALIELEERSIITMIYW